MYKVPMGIKVPMGFHKYEYKYSLLLPIKDCVSVIALLHTFTPTDKKS